MKNGTLVEILVKGGLAGVALLSMYLFFLFASNHVAHNTEVLIRMEETAKAGLQATIELTGVVRELNAIIK